MIQKSLQTTYNACVKGIEKMHGTYLTSLDALERAPERATISLVAKFVGATAAALPLALTAKGIDVLSQKIGKPVERKNPFKFKK